MTVYLTPYRRMSNLRNAMNRLIEENIEEAPSEREMLLSLDITANEDAYDLTAFVPGLEADELNIEIINNTVALRGEFATEEKKETQYLSCELPSGRFSRVVTLPTALDPAKAEASIKNGVLKLHIPKAEAHRPKAIKVKAN
ncbi:MAG: Hsp20/alpha crystallin family protein [Anaerolineales bacterium]|nr:Hsp20/alpha crystallin family protein [Anaerolineales bacterium]